LLNCCGSDVPGYFIVKHLMIAHGGRMEIQSQLGKGTKVSLSFPLTHGNRE